MRATLFIGSILERIVRQYQSSRNLFRPLGGDIPPEELEILLEKIACEAFLAMTVR